MSKIILSYIARDAGSDRNYSIIGHECVPLPEVLLTSIFDDRQTS